MEKESSAVSSKVTGKIIFSASQARSMVGGSIHFLVLSIAIVLFILILAITFQMATEDFSKIIVLFGIVILAAALAFIGPWIFRFKNDVVATDEGIGFGVHFFNWSEITKIRSVYGGRIDVYGKKNGKEIIFCFGTPFNYGEFQERYKKTFHMLEVARNNYLISK